MRVRCIVHAARVRLNVYLAHHARKNHPYNQILRDFYYTCEAQHRPKIFGMTASPVWNHKNPGVSLQTLEYNLHAKVVGVLENKDELWEHSPRPIEVPYSVKVFDLY
jgi:endoribonuclease Dicer